MRRWYELAAAGAVGGAAVALVVMVLGTVLLTGAGTGDFLDPWRAAGSALTSGSTWAVTAGGAVAGALVGAVVGALRNTKN